MNPESVGTATERHLMATTADREATALVFDRDTWENAKRGRGDIAVGEMERLEGHAANLSHLLIFDLEVWEGLKCDAGAGIAVGDMERLEAIGELR